MHYAAYSVLNEACALRCLPPPARLLFGNASVGLVDHRTALPWLIKLGAQVTATPPEPASRSLRPTDPRRVIKSPPPEANGGGR